MRIRTLVFAMAFAFASSAYAALSEVEVNDTVALANPIPVATYLVDGGAGVLGHLSPGDVDCFSFAVVDPTALVIGVVRDFTPSNGYDNDSFMGLFDPTATLVETNDDNVELGFGSQDPGFMSSIAYLVTPGIWTFCITGYPDTNFDGLSDFDGTPHPQNFDYLFDFSYVPEPGTMALLLAGSALLARRRR